jgi:signal transduction histidine kinase
MDRIRTSAQRMVAMLDDLMVYARMGTEEFEAAPVDLCERVRMVLEELQPQAEQKGVRIDGPAGATPGCTIVGDRRFMVRVLTNIIGNAVKYIETPDGGEVVVRLGVQGRFARLTVTDNGPGIAPALLDEVFQPFRRASAGTDGTGLGLALVRRYVTAMGGRVWLESDGEHGTTAVMELPLAAAGYAKRGRRAA